MLYFAPWKTVLIWLTVAVGVAFALPNLYPQSVRDSLPDVVPSDSLALGLDLQGGVHLQLRLDRDDLVEQRLEATRDEVRRLLRAEGIGYTGLSGQGQTVGFTLRDPSDADAMREALADLTTPVTTGLLTGGTVREIVLSGPDANGRYELEITDQGLDYRMAGALTQTVEVIRGRIDELGTTEPVIQRQGADRIIVQVPGLDDPERLKELIGTTARLAFRMVDVTTPVEDALGSRPPVGTEILYSTDDPPIPYVIETREIVTGENLEDAQAGFDQRTNEPIVTFRFDGTGAQRFGRATQENVGRPFAIVLDDQVISAPVIREPILGGTGQISGNFTVDGANDLAILLRAGALPLKPTFVEERTVGPSLGADSIAAGEIAGIIGAFLVVGFMFVAYGFLGLIANLALLRGMIGRQYAGLLPLRGHSNVQGIGTIGVKPLVAEDVFAKMEEAFSITLSRQMGFDTMASLAAAHRGDIDAAVIMGGNLYGASPDTAWARTALDRIGFKLFLTTTLNLGHVNGHDKSESLILPVTARDEEWEPTTQESMFNFVRLSDGGIDRLENVRPESVILCDLAARLMPDCPIDFSAFKQHSAVREAIAGIVPGLEDLKDIDVAKREFHIRNRVMHTPQFGTADGKAHFVPVAEPKRISAPNGKKPLTLATIRSEGQFNTIVYEDKDSYRKSAPRWSVLLNGQDMEELGIAEGELIDIASANGQMKQLVALSFDIPPGSALAYYPEANVLVGTQIDPRSKTPAFKSVPVWVE